MQRLVVTRGARSAACGVLAACAAWSFAAPTARADSFSSGVFVHTDSDRTVVVSPRVHIDQSAGEATNIDLTYAADVWTSASVDIRASASLPVTEQRDEIDVNVTHEATDLTLSGGYRYSVENDYVSHGGSAGLALDLADHNSTIALSGYAFGDTVGRAGAPQIARGLVTVGSRLSFTQVLGRATLAQLAYEFGHLQGYQASPYRWVGFGGTGFGCEMNPDSRGTNSVPIPCLPEHVPDQRVRHAAAVQLRQGLSDALSVGAGYRLYLDNWGLTSHTLSAQFGWLLADSSLLTLRYRYYRQSGVDFYRMVYTQLSNRGVYTTRDREQSPMQDHRIGLELEQRIALDDHGAKFVFRLGAAGVLFSYAAFAGLSSVRALELTVAFGIER